MFQEPVHNLKLALQEPDPGLELEPASGFPHLEQELELEPKTSFPRLKLEPESGSPRLDLEPESGTPRLELESESGTPRLGFVQLNSGDTSFNTTLNLTGPILLGLGIAAATLFYAYFNAFQG